MNEVTGENVDYNSFYMYLLKYVIHLYFSKSYTVPIIRLNTT